MKIAIVVTLELAKRQQKKAVEKKSREIDLVEFLAIFPVVVSAIQGWLHLRFSLCAGDVTKFQKIA